MGVGVIVPVRMLVAVTMGVAMSMVVLVGVGRGGSHLQTLYYNITPVHGWTDIPAQGLPITMAIAAATNGNGTETAQRNQTKRAGMNGISHKITRWKANSAQATT
ncbi:hypothetical protein AB7M16_004687 [Bradyrhizobium sp. USDA 372]